MELNIPGYKLKRVLGKGGMARVYLAEQKIFGRDVALKLMSKHLSEDPNFGKRFLREAQIVAKLVHPNIVTVHDVGVHDGYYYLSMEYIDGRDLKARRKHLSLTEKINAVRDIAKALDYAGSKGYVHRDIKPENIMFHKSDNRAVLTDFGIARAAETDLAMTQTGIAIGTPHYMSPEQAKGKAVDGRSDIYSLGVVFYLLLTGKVPYEGDSAVSIGIKHITEPVPFLPLEYKSLQNILDRMMGKVIDQRYQSAAKLIDDLDAIEVPEIEHLESLHKDESVSPPALNIRSRSELNKSLSGTDDFSITEESIRALPNPTVIWPWLISLVLVFSLVFSALYILRPQPLVPYIDQLESSGKNWKQKIENKLAPADSDSNDQGLEGQPSKQHVLNGQTKVNSLNDRSLDPDSNISSLDVVASTQTAPKKTEAIQQKVSENIPDSVSDFVLQKYRNQLSMAKKAYESDSELVVEYVDAHRDLLANYPDDKQTLDSLNNLQAKLKNNLFEKARIGKPITARKLLTQYRYLFSNLPEKSKIDLENQLSSIAKSRSHVKKADKHFKNKSISKPKGENAIELYQSALALDPLNAKARAGMSKSLDALLGFAEENLKNGRKDVATFQANLVLSFDPQNNQAKDILLSINTKSIDSSNDKTVDSIAQLKSLYEQAISARDSGYLYEPSGENAYDFYLAMLNHDGSNGDAKQGLEELLMLLSEKVNNYLSKDELINARSALYRPLEVMPKNIVVQSLVERVDFAIQEKQKSVLPNISVAISNENTQQVQTQASLSDSVGTNTINGALPWYVFLAYEKITAQNSNINIEILGLPGLQDIFSISKTLQGSSGTLTLSSLEFDLKLEKGAYQIQVSMGASSGNDEVMDQVIFTVY